GDVRDSVSGEEGGTPPVAAKPTTESPHGMHVSTTAIQRLEANRHRVQRTGIERTELRVRLAPSLPQAARLATDTDEFSQPSLWPISNPSPQGIAIRWDLPPHRVWRCRAPRSSGRHT